MIKTEELLQLCDSAESYEAPVWWPNFKGLPVHVPPQTLRQLVELCRLQHETIERCVSTTMDSDSYEQVMSNAAHFVNQALAAFERFEKGE